MFTLKVLSKTCVDLVLGGSQGIYLIKCVQKTTSLQENALEYVYHE